MSEITLMDGKTMTAWECMPKKTPLTPKYLPLVVAVHGGSYAADYFDADAKHSISNISNSLSVPTVAINRPGYKGSPQVEIPSGSTLIQAQGQYLHEVILPSLWKEYSGKGIGVNAIVLYAHSVGAAVAIAAASLYTPKDAKYPLAGMSISGLGHILQPGPHEQFKFLRDNVKPPTVRFPNDAKDGIMLGSPDLYDAAILQQTDTLNNEFDFAEMADINSTWLEYRERIAGSVQIPVQYVGAEHDSLWKITPEAVDEFASAFKNSPSVESKFIPSAPHCIELSLLSASYTARVYAFAIEVTIDKMIRAGRTEAA